MPLYELVCIAAHHTNFAPLQSLATTTAALVLQNGGLVRLVDHWGNRHVPQTIKRGDEEAHFGDYWTMRFDANPPTVAALNARLKLDPRVLRWTTLKIATTLPELTSSKILEDPSIKYSRKPMPEVEVNASESSKSGTPVASLTPPRNQRRASRY